MTARLPDLYEQIRTAPGLGEAAALRFVHDFGGQRIYVPRSEHLHADHPLARSLGLTAARALSDLIGYGHLDVPFGPAVSSAKRRRMIRLLMAEGLSSNKIAKRVGVTRRCVQMHRGREPAVTRDLFVPPKRK